MRSALLTVFVLVSTATVYDVAYAQTRTFDDWTVMISTDKEDLIAATTLDNDKYLAYRCFGKIGKCMHAFNLATECEDRKDYPVLVNSSYSALAMTCKCSKNGTAYELIPDFAAFHKLLLNSSGYIGFA